MNENTLFTLFEEIKSSLAEIKVELEESKKMSAKEEQTCKFNSLYSRFDDFWPRTEKLIAQGANFTKNEIVRNIDGNRVKLEEFIKSDLDKLGKLKQHHVHTLNSESAKVILLIASLLLGLFISTNFLFITYSKLGELENNDWKYRYIKSMKGIDKEGLGGLENVFEYSKDEEMMAKIKDHVIKYEESLKTKAENLEQHELMDSNN